MQNIPHAHISTHPPIPLPIPPPHTHLSILPFIYQLHMCTLTYLPISSPTPPHSQSTNHISSHLLVLSTIPPYTLTHTLNFHFPISLPPSSCTTIHPLIISPTLHTHPTPHTHISLLTILSLYQPLTYPHITILSSTPPHTLTHTLPSIAFIV